VKLPEYTQAMLLEQCIGNADLFPILERWQYFNHAGVSPWPKMTIDAVRRFAESFGVDAFMTDPWGSEHEATRNALARLINARPDEVAVIRNTGDAISMVSSGLHWQAGDRIVLPRVEYPSNVYPWMDVCDRFGAELIMVDETIDADGIARVEEDELLRACEHPRTRLLALSHVQWASGQRMDVEKLGQACHARGVLFAVDAIQSLGVVPLDVRRAQIDFAFAGGHKWLMGPPGAGLLYCRRELIERVNPPIVGWLSVVNPMKWELNYTRRTEAGKFETGTHAFACLVGLRHSVEFLLSVGIDAINAHVRTLGDRFVEGAQDKGYLIATDRRGPVGGAVCFTTKNHAPDDLLAKLRAEHRVELAFRSGRLRFSPHLYNTIGQVDHLLDVLPRG
jgi:cysteine desulfurase / selenocysteine lyase